MNFLNFFGLYNGIVNFNGLIQYSFLFLLFISIYYEKLKKNKKIIIFFIILFSNPIILPLIISQKPFLISVLIFFIIFYLLKNLSKKNNPNINTITLILIISGLNFALSSKYNFIIPFLIFEFFLLFYFRNLFLNICIINLVFFLIISFPIYYKNYYFYGNPIVPFFDNIFSSDYLSYEKTKFSNYLKNSIQTITT